MLHGGTNTVLEDRSTFYRAESNTRAYMLHGRKQCKRACMLHGRNQYNLQEDLHVTSTHGREQNKRALESQVTNRKS